MKNSRFPDGGALRPGYGPLPAVPRLPPALSGTRAALLGMLRARPGPTALAGLAARSGRHPNTVREHLDALVHDGLARRRGAPAVGRGRPAWLYEATDPRPDTSKYAGLASALAAAIRSSSANPTQDAVAAGQEWGRSLARGRGGSPAGTAAQARREVVALLDELGFGPEPDSRSATVRLTRCPLLEAAQESPDVVCGVHLGLARGALEEYGADPDGAHLGPFSEPGACRLQLARRR